MPRLERHNIRINHSPHPIVDPFAYIPSTMSTGSEEPSFFESIYLGEPVVSLTRKPGWETRIPSPAKENRSKWVASPRTHVSALPMKTIFTTPKPLPKTPHKNSLPLGCATNGRKQVAFASVQSTDEIDDNGSPHYPRPIYREAELVATRAHELVADMSLALEIIVKNSPAKRRNDVYPHPRQWSASSGRRSSGAELDDAEFACEFGLEQYREGFQRRSMQSEPSPVKLAEKAVEEIRRKLKCELREEVKKELEAEVREEIKGELYDELAELASQHGQSEHGSDRHDLKFPDEKDSQCAASTEHHSDGHSLNAAHRNTTCSDLGRRKESMSIQDMVKGLRDDMSDVEEYEDAVEERAGPVNPALARFLGWRAPPRSDASGSVYSQ